MRNLNTGIFTLCILILLSACEKNKATDDAAMVDAIANASNKILIDEANLPTVTKTILSTDYTESFSEKVLFADGLGYEIERRKHSGILIGEGVKCYFNKNGKSLSKFADKKDLDWYEDKAKDKKECFDFVYPITLTMPDASIISGDDKEEIADNLKAWYITNPTNKEKPSIQYPINVQFKDGTIKPIDSKEDLMASIKYCKGLEKNVCFKFVYPISFELPDGTLAIGADKDELTNQIKAWHIANPNATEKGSLVYPIQLEFDDGSVDSVEDQTELKAAFEDCK